MSQIQREKLTFDLFCIFVLVQEKGLALSFTVNGDNHVSKRFHEKLYWLNKSSYCNLLDCFRFLLVELHIVKSDQIIGCKNKIEIFADHK